MQPPLHTVAASITYLVKRAVRRVLDPLDDLLELGDVIGYVLALLEEGALRRLYAMEAATVCNGGCHRM